MLLFWSCEPGKPVQPPENPVPGGNRAPTARISGPETGREGAVVMFSARGSTDPDPTDSLQYTWASGDGRTFNGPNVGLVEQGWIYADDGVYTVALIVADRSGAADTASTNVTIVNTPPYVARISPPTHQAVGFSAPFRISTIDSGSVDTHFIIIRWGDGTSDSVAAGNEMAWSGDKLTTVNHSYAKPGSYTVGATVRDNDGGIGSATANDPAIVFDPAERQLVAGYEVFDLGTLGGSSARPNDINDYGRIVGSSQTAAADTHAFVWHNGTMRDLGTLGGESSAAERINNAGLIAGGVWTGFNAYGRPRSLATTWDAATGAGTTWGTGYPITAAAMNESGVIAWFASGYAFEYGYFSRGGTLQRIGSLLDREPPSSTPKAINERGQIVGKSPTGDYPPNYHAFIWEDGRMRDLGLLGFTPCDNPADTNCGEATATGINENGQIPGWSTAADGSMHAVLWENGTIKALWTEPDSSTWTRWDRWAVINDAGQVAGSGNGEGFFWSHGSVRSLGSLGGGGTVVVDMNESGAVAGTSLTATGEQHAFVWTAERGMVDLGTGPAGFGCAWVVGISFGGDIAGYTAPENTYVRCSYARGETRAVMWRKIP